MNTKLISNLETKIEHLHAFIAVGSIEGFQDLNNNIQQSYLNAICHLSLEIKDEYQQVIEMIKKDEKE